MNGVYILVGVLMMLASIALLWSFIPRGGKSHPWSEHQIFQSLFPIVVMVLFVFGAAIIVSTIV